MLFGTSNPPPPSGQEKETWSSWLDRAERETWQMELLLTGFVIILLAQAKSPMDKWLELLHNNGGTNDFAEAIAIGANMLLPSAWLVLFSSLIFGVVLRALWISAIGLRSVSGDIEFEKLNFAPKFQDFLDRRVPTFDQYIARLENICSIIFGLTFLCVFALIGGSILILTTMLIVQIFVHITDLFFEDKSETIGLFVVFIISISTFLIGIIGVYAIDFLSGSKLKQHKGFSRFYYPIYRVMGWLTLARIYRPLYYNFIDNRTGKYGILAIIPYGLILLTIAQFDNSGFSEYLPSDQNYAFGHMNNYADSHDGIAMSKVMINSKLIDDDHLQLYIPLGGRNYKILEEACGEVSKSYDKLNYVSLTDNTRFSRYTDFIKCVSCTYSCFIDSTEVDLPVGILVQNPTNGESQILTVIDVSEVQPGAHVLRIVAHLGTKRKSREFATTIPFFRQ